MRKKSDLTPPLGFPGGTCHVVDRIQDEVKSPAVRDSLSETVESGRDLSNPEASKVYDIEIERGPGDPFNKIKLTAHVQYRMDLRSITVPEIRLALSNFLKDFRKGLELEHQSVSKPKLVQLKNNALRWRSVIQAGGGVEYTDPKTGLFLVFEAKRGVATLVTAYWTNIRDPRPQVCRRRSAGFRAPVEDWAVQTFTRPPESEPRPPVLPIPEGKSRENWIPKFEYNTSDQDLADGTVTPGGSSIPGEQYGHPWKEDATQRRTDKIAEVVAERFLDECGSDKEAYTPRKRQWGRQQKSRGQTRRDRQKYYRRNRSRIKRQQQRYRRRVKRNPAYQRAQKRRREMLRRNPRRFRRRRASVLTAPEIVFFTGPDLEVMGHVHCISPMTGMVTFRLENSRIQSVSIAAFAASVVFVEGADEDAFLDLVDVEIGLDAYEELMPEDVLRCSEAFGVDPGSKEFQSKCMEEFGTVDLTDLTTSELETAVSKFVANLHDSEAKFRDGDEDDVLESDDIDFGIDGLIYGQVDREEEDRTAFVGLVHVEGLGGTDGYPSMYNPLNTFPDFDGRKPGAGPLDITPVNDGGSSAKVIPEIDTDLVNHTYDRSKIAARIADILTGVDPKVVERSQKITPKLVRVDQKNGIWTFRVPGQDQDHYTVKIKARRRGRTQDLSKLDVEVSCSCDFWRWQGPEYHAVSEDYLYGKPRGTASTPDIRDPDRTHRACKHMVSVLDVAKGYWLRPLAKKSSAHRVASVWLDVSGEIDQ